MSSQGTLMLMLLVPEPHLEVAPHFHPQGARGWDTVIQLFFIIGQGQLPEMWPPSTCGLRYVGWGARAVDAMSTQTSSAEKCAQGMGSVWHCIPHQNICGQSRQRTPSPILYPFWNPFIPNLQTVNLWPRERKFLVQGHWVDHGNAGTKILGSRSLYPFQEPLALLTALSLSLSFFNSWSLLSWLVNVNDDEFSRKKSSCFYLKALFYATGPLIHHVFWWPSPFWAWRWHRKQEWNGHGYVLFEA